MSYLALLCALLIGIVVGSFASFSAGAAKGYEMGFEEFRAKIASSCDAVIATCTRSDCTFAEALQSIKMMAEALRNDTPAKRMTAGN